MDRTSINLPLGVFDQLAEAATNSGYSKQYLATKCLKRYKRNLSKLRINRFRSTTMYNAEGPSRKLYVYWTEPMHNYAQTLRITTKHSVSLLVAMALLKFLARVVRILANTRFSRAMHIENMVHRNLRFQNRRMVGLSFVIVNKHPRGS